MQLHRLPTGQAVAVQLIGQRARRALPQRGQLAFYRQLRPQLLVDCDCAHRSGVRDSGFHSVLAVRSHSVASSRSTASCWLTAAAHTGAGLGLRVSQLGASTLLRATRPHDFISLRPSSQYSICSSHDTVKEQHLLCCKGP